jgi:hypothetical protein
MAVPPVVQTDDCADVAARWRGVIQCADGWWADGRRAWWPAKEPATGHSTICCTAAAYGCARAMATARHWRNPLQITRRSRQAPDANRRWPRRCGIGTGTGLFYRPEADWHPGVGSRRSFTHPRRLDGRDQTGGLDRYLPAIYTSVAGRREGQHREMTTIGVYLPAGTTPSTGATPPLTS